MQKIIIVLTVLFSGFQTFSQEKVSGKIFYENNKPLQGATIYWKNSEIGTTTDENGNFSIPFSSEYSQLVISYVGFKTVELTVTSPKAITQLLEYDNTLDEVTLTKERNSLQKNYMTPANV